jgi:ssDNA-binding Zn-finger/Zn-ribbon topoisomerase 1
MSKHESMKAKIERQAKTRLEEAKTVIATGKCPRCQTALVLNSTIRGWYQCGAYPDDKYRKPEFKGLPQCGFQVFGV